MSESWNSLKLIKWTTDFFEKKGVPNPRLDAELLLAHVRQCSRIELYTQHETNIPEKDLAQFKELIQRRIAREPLQYILGETEFWGLKFKLTPDVLIPRPETELLVEECLKTVGAAPRGRPDNISSLDGVPTEEGHPRRGAPTILEIGTGSGCIAIALAKHVPESHIIATDISPSALDVAKLNANLHEVSDRIQFIQADIAPWSLFQAEQKTFDMIVSNPPYISTAQMNTLAPELGFEPRNALEGGEDGLVYYRKILASAPAFLKKGGRIVFEIGEEQGSALGEFIKESGMVLKEILKDYAGQDRVVVGEKPIVV